MAAIAVAISRRNIINKCGMRGALESKLNTLDIIVQYT